MSSVVELSFTVVQSRPYLVVLNCALLSSKASSSSKKESCCLHVCNQCLRVRPWILFCDSSALPPMYRNGINPTGGMPWHSSYKECHCRAHTMRQGWIYIEPLWWTQTDAERGAQRRSLCLTGQTVFWPKCFTLMFQIPSVSSKVTQSEFMCGHSSQSSSPSAVKHLHMQ